MTDENTYKNLDSITKAKLSEYRHIMMFYGIDSPQCIEWLQINCNTNELAELCDAVKQLRIRLSKDDPYRSVIDKMKDYE